MAMPTSLKASKQILYKVTGWILHVRAYMQIELGSYVFNTEALHVILSHHNFLTLKSMYGKESILRPRGEKQNIISITIGY
jgi:hypothetical protein